MCILLSQHSEGMPILFEVQPHQKKLEYMLFLFKL